MSEGQHYFEDQENVAVRFVGEDLWGMDQYYSELVPKWVARSSHYYCQNEWRGT